MGGLAAVFGDLFAGRQDAYGSDEGKAIRPVAGGEWPSYLERIEVHLHGSTPIGVYPMVQNLSGDYMHWLVKWGCVDFDGHRDGDVRAHAHNVASALHLLGATPWVERTRSGHGYHVWLFCEDWENSTHMRRALLGACQLVDAPTKEINPKSWSLAEGQLGNYVRLPYPKGWASRCTQAMVTEHDVMVTFEDFLLQADSHRLEHDRLLEIAGMYQEPPKPVVAEVKRRERVNSRRGSDQHLGGLAYTIWNDGPLSGADRSDTLYHLCCLMREEGKLSYAEALDLLVDADLRWGKFMQRPNGDRTLTQMLDRVWH